MSWIVLQDDCIEAMRAMDEVSVDAIVTDPPYGLEFMGKEWDRLDGPQWGTNAERWGERPKGGTDPFERPRPRYGTSSKQMQGWHQAWATEALRVLKPGGHLLAFGGTRTYHRLACAIEDAGFEIRDSVMWLYGSGFPKSHNLKDEWQGYGTALKPAHEPIVVARKPLIGTVAANVTTFGTGALNIDATRVKGEPWKAHRATGLGSVKFFTEGETPEIDKVPHTSGRWPANLLLSHAEDCEPVGTRKVKGDGHFPKHKPTLGDGEKYGTAKPFDQTERHMADPDGTETVEAFRCAEGGCPVAELDRQSGNRPGATSFSRPKEYGASSYQVGDAPLQAGYNDSGGASRFFPTFRYQAKASRAERNAGLEGFEERERGNLSQGFQNIPTGSGNERTVLFRNSHPTVKPLALMRWLVRLVGHPGATILDPFAGSGTTGCAAVLEGFDFIGIEREAEYVEIARARIAHWERTKPLQLDVEEAA